jgi:hypothetical protein
MSFKKVNATCIPAAALISGEVAATGGRNDQTEFGSEERDGGIEGSRGRKAAEETGEGSLEGE